VQAPMRFPYQKVRTTNTTRLWECPTPRLKNNSGEGAREGVACYNRGEDMINNKKEIHVIYALMFIAVFWSESYFANSPPQLSKKLRSQRQHK